MIKKVFMVSTVIVLIFLIIITPTFISQQAPIGSFPRVLIDHMEYSVLVDVRAALEDYRYHNMSIRVTGLGAPGYHPPPIQSNETYGIQATVLKNDTREFTLNITLYDQLRQGYVYNTTVRIVSGQDGEDIMVVKRDSIELARTPIGGYFRDVFVARSVGG